MSVRDDLLARVDIVDVVSRYVDLKRTGKNRLGLCPFHKEKSPSFTVAEDKQIYKCFGCGKGGSAVNFVMEIERIDYRDAIKELARTANFDLTPYERNPEIHEKRQQERQILKTVNAHAQDYFRLQFAGSTAESYIVDKRKLTVSTRDIFGIGYAPESYVGLIDYLKSKGCSAEEMMQAGLVTKGTGGLLPFFRNRVTFPIIDHANNIVGFGARALLPDQQPKYLNTTETALYEKSSLLFGLDKAKQQLREYGFLIVVEGYMDVIAMHQYGIPLGVATCGTALTPEHIKLLKRHSDQMVLLFDNDQAGFDATVRALKIAYAQDLYPRAYSIPSAAKDVDERLTSVGDQVAPAIILSESVDGFAFVMQKRRSQLDITNPVYRKKFQYEMFEILQTLEDYGVLLLQLEVLGGPLGLTVSEMVYEFKNRLKQYKRGVYKQQNESGQTKNPDRLKLLATLYHDDYRKKISSHQDVAHQIDMMRSLLPYITQPLLQSLASDTIDVSLTEELLTLQLRREQQVVGFTPDKVVQMLVSFLKEQTRLLIQDALKNTTLSSEQKELLLKMMR